MQRLRDTDGMTLIELLLVLTIVSILTYIALPRYSGVLDKTKIATAQSGMLLVLKGINYYQADNESLLYPPSSMITSYDDLRQVVSEYVGWLPTQDEADFIFVSYTADDTSFTVTSTARDRYNTVITGSIVGVRRH